jgi:iron complex outermembrane receptor protein
MRERILLGAFLLASVAPVSLPALAQTKTTSVDNDSVTGIETVTVTARRRVEDVEKVPAAITPISSETLRSSGTHTAIELQTLAPSLTVTGNLGSRDTDVFTIRGQSQPFGGADPGVQTYFAEVPFDASGRGSDYDLESIQVLNGPQGTLFGRNTTGGAILFEPKKPGDELGGYLDMSFTNYAGREAQAAVNIPLMNDTLLVRVAGDMAERNGFTRDISTGGDLDNVDYQAFRVGVTWHPFEGFENYVLFDYLNNRNNGTGAELTAIAPEAALVGIAEKFGLPPATAAGLVGAFYPTLQFALANQQALGPRKTTSSIPLFYRRRSWGVTDIATYDINAHLHLKNIFGYRSDKEQPAFDYDGSFLPILDIPNPRTWESNSVQVTEEFQVLGDDGSFNWIAGFYHELDHPGGYSEVERDTFGGAAGPFAPLSSTEIESLSNGGSSNAVYGSATYDAADWIQGLSLTAGGRYTWDSKVADASICEEPLSPFCPSPLPKAIFGLPTLKANFHAPSWTLAVNYQASDDTFLYATYRRGYKSGGFNSGAEGSGLEEFKPEYLTDAEIGAKNNWTILGIPAQTNIDAYYGWYNDIQKNDLVLVENIPPAPSGLDALTFNAAKATVKGVEFQGTIIPNENIQLSAFYSYTDATYSKFTLPDVIFAGTPIDVLNHVGDPFAYTPRNKFGLTGRFHIPLDPAWGLPVLTAQWYEQSKVWFTDISDEEPDGFQKSYNLVNLRLDWDHFLGSPFDAAVFANNVANKTYKVASNALEHEIGTTASIYGEPRIIGVELRMRFGQEGR